ncbi:putative mediator of RNA polymerase II transcription subunit 26 [Condylostylus longicornis]|uniref:putative mediator of RNA polymerase II transcription subunit 26 n=1 Tax=Condylostylus longicornis TaxID=2530218 RepID=UPI00244DD616|nr:putative mediator of RNA polymerase II transcription subunit 26 [Condylostylus longicornis]XP_055390185.1 putative mediator of RNA polymerase II transcription subunit 26 [Condylostylus longicornis]
MSADSPRRAARGVPAIVPPQVVSDRSIIDNVAGFINDVALTNQPQGDPKDTIAWARFEQSADISDPTFGDDWEIDGNISPPLLLILGYGLGVQVWAIPANGEAIEVLSWRHGHVSTLRILPTPFTSDDEMANEPIDNYVDKRPLMAICDGSASISGSVQTCYSVNFVSLKTGAQVKTIKFKYAVLDVLANRTSVVITFPERIAVFDARTLEDRLSVTTCYPSPGINPNPVALGPRWMAYAENKVLHSKRSGGGCDGDGVSSYTATVLNAAKSFGKGLRELGEQVAAGLTGSTPTGLSSKSGSFDSGSGDVKQAGIITILDIKNPIKDVSPTTGAPISINGSDPFIAHFIAHSEAVVAMEFDYSGMLLITADRRGHDFHVFRIQPHPAGSHLAAVHHLYILHRGDTTAKVQNITFALDSRWVAISTLRGTTHVFPITPYGGPYGVRTHSSLHVVNKLSRFHRSAGLSGDNRSNSPISHSESMTFNQLSMPYHNPTMPPFPRPHTILPLAQLRQPSVLASPPGSAQNLSYQKSIVGGTTSNRQRLSSLSDDSGKPLSVCAVFSKGRSWLLDPPNVAREAPAHKLQRKAVDSLFIMAGHGALIQYDLDTKLASNVAKEKICDDTPIELEVEAKAQWNLGRRESFLEIQPPLTSDNWLVKDRNSFIGVDAQYEDCDDRSERWLSQVEIITHAGPHRRLWMGPQFVFKTYNTPSGSSLSHIDSEAIEIGITPNTNKPGRSSPMNMPLGNSGRSAVPVLIESGSYSSIEQSPKLMDRFKHDHMDSDFTLTQGESRLKEDLADAMRESPSVHKDTGYTPMSTTASNITNVSTSRKLRENTASVQPSYTNASTSFSTTSFGGNITTQIRKISKNTNLSSSMTSSLTIPEEDDIETSSESACISIEKIVNPLGTVTTITRSPSDTDIEKTTYDPADHVILENCDESLFRPVVTIFCDEKNTTPRSGENSNSSKSKNVKNFDKNCSSNKMEGSDYFKKPPEPIGTKLVVPVIEKSIKIESATDNEFNNTNRNLIKNNKDSSVSTVEKGNIKQKVDKTEENMNKVYKPVNSKDNKIEDTIVGAVGKIKSEKPMNQKSCKVSDIKVEKNETDNSQRHEKAQSSHAISELNLKKLHNQKNSKKESDDSDENSSKTIVTVEGNRKGNSESYKETNSKQNYDIQEKNVDINKRTVEVEIKIKNKEKLNDEMFVETNDSTKNNMSAKTADEAKNLVCRKSSKDEDSESYESLENIDEYEKSLESKQRKLSDNFDSAEDCHHESDLSSGNTSKKWEINEESKADKQTKAKKQETINQIMNSSSSNSIEVTITLPKKGKNIKKNDQTKLKIKKEFNDELQKNEIAKSSGLEFFDKFSHTDDKHLKEKTKTVKDNLKFSPPDLDVILRPLSPESESLMEDELKKEKSLEKTNQNTCTESNYSNKINTDNLNVDLSVTTSKKKLKKMKLPLSIKLKEDKKESSSTKNEKNANDILPAIYTTTSNFLENDLDFPALPAFDNFSNDFKETFLPPLSPLGIFETKFDEFQNNDSKKSDDHFSLINFESPESPKNTPKKLSAITSIEPKPRGFTQDTLIFALCGSLHYEDENEVENMNISTDSSEIISKKDSDSSNLLTSKTKEELVAKLTLEEELLEKNSNTPTLTKRKNKKKEKNLSKASLQVSTVAATSSSTSSSEETEESSSSAACNKRQKNIIGDEEELRPLIDVSMSQSISCGTGSSLSEISSGGGKPSTTKNVSKKTKTMSQILKGEIDDEEDDCDTDADKRNKSTKCANVDVSETIIPSIVNKEFDCDDNSVSTTITLSIPNPKRGATATKKSKTSLPDVNSQSDSSTTSDQVKTSEEQVCSDSSDEQQLISLKKINSRNNKNSSSTTIITSDIPINEDSSESDTKISNVEAVSTGNDSGSGGGGNGSNNINNSIINKSNNNNSNSSNNTNQNNKKKLKKKKR